MTRVTQLIHDAGKYLLISVYPLPTHPTHNFTHNNGGNLETLPGWPKKLQHNRPARSAGQWCGRVSNIQLKHIICQYRLEPYVINRSPGTDTMHPNVHSLGHDDARTWKLFLYYWSFVRGILRSAPVPLTKTRVMQSVFISFVVSLNKLLWYHCIGSWFITLWINFGHDMINKTVYISWDVLCNLLFS